MLNQKSKIILPVMIIITILLFCTITHALEVNENNLRTLTLYGMQSADSTTNTWHGISFTNENGKITGSFQTGSQYRIALIFNYDSIKVESIDLSFKIKINNSSLGSGDKFLRMQNNGNTLFDWSINIEQSSNIYTITSNHVATNKFDSNGFTLGAYITFVSSTIEIYDINVSINDETYQIVSALNNVSSDIESALANDTLPEYNESDLPSIVNNQYIIHDETISNWFTQSIYDLEIVKIVVFAGLAFAFMGFLLYGKKG